MSPRRKQTNVDADDADVDADVDYSIRELIDTKISQLNSFRKISLYLDKTNHSASSNVVWSPRSERR